MKPLPYHITTTDLEFGNILPGKKQQLESDLAKNLQTQELTLQVFRESLVHCNHNQFSKSKIVWNAAGYINLISFDLKIIAKHLYSSESEWEKRYFGRQAALLIHEGIDDLFELFGKSLKNIIDALPNADVLSSNRKEITKRLNEYKSVYNKRLDELRNFCIAHRDLDVLAQIDVICGMSWTEAIQMIAGFDRILIDAGTFMQQLLHTGYFDEDKKM